jgi:hypothetical protein
MDNQEFLDDVTPEEWDALTKVTNATISSIGTPLGNNTTISSFGNASMLDGSTIVPSTFQSYSIQGKMFVVEKTFASITGVSLSQITDDNLKRMLLTELVEELMNSKCIEFTKQHEPHTGNIVVRARMYVVPDDQVQILRTNGIK